MIKTIIPITELILIPFYVIKRNFASIFVPGLFFSSFLTLIYVLAFVEKNQFYDTTHENLLYTIYLKLTGQLGAKVNYAYPFIFILENCLIFLVISNAIYKYEKKAMPSLFKWHKVLRVMILFIFLQITVTSDQLFIFLKQEFSHNLEFKFFFHLSSIVITSGLMITFFFFPFYWLIHRENMIKALRNSMSSLMSIMRNPAYIFLSLFTLVNVAIMSTLWKMPNFHYQLFLYQNRLNDAIISNGGLEAHYTLDAITFLVLALCRVAVAFIFMPFFMITLYNLYRKLIFLAVEGKAPRNQLKGRRIVYSLTLVSGK